MILFCAEAPELKLGPGVSVGDPDVIVFRAHFAEIDNDDPLLREKLGWVHHPGTPPIRILDEDEAPAVTGAVTCPQCAAEGITKAFATDKQLGGHLLSHLNARKGVSK